MPACGCKAIQLLVSSSTALTIVPAGSPCLSGGMTSKQSAPAIVLIKLDWSMPVGRAHASPSRNSMRLRT